MQSYIISLKSNQTDNVILHVRMNGNIIYASGVFVTGFLIFLYRKNYRIIEKFYHA